MDTKEKSSDDNALPHVVTSLIDKRRELVGRINHFQDGLRQAAIDLENVEMTLALYQPASTTPGLGMDTGAPPGSPPAKLLLAILGATDRPLTTNELARQSMLAQGLCVEDAKLFRIMAKRVGAALRHLRAVRGLVKSMPGPGQQIMWQIESANDP